MRWKKIARDITANNMNALKSPRTLPNFLPCSMFKKEAKKCDERGFVPLLTGHFFLRNLNEVQNLPRVSEDI